MVGAERSDEFMDALRLAGRGHRVVVVNPRQTIAARRFASAGGAFIRSAIERLPLALGPFDLICENYPFTVGLVKGVCEEDPCPVWLSTRRMRAYAMARLRHLGPRGRWIVWTESPGFAAALRSLVQRDDAIRRRFSVRIVPLATAEGPRSSYPHLSTRFQVMFQRRPAGLRGSTRLPPRRVSL